MKQWFNLIAIAVAMAFTLVGVLMLAGVIPGLKGGGRGEEVELTFWGTIPAEKLNFLLSEFNGENQGDFSLKYIEKNSAAYESELIDALAAGRGPDIWLLSQDLIFKYSDKVFILPFESFSQRLFKNTFIEEGELYMSQDGIISFPLIVDPMILYWNRDFFSASGISSPPRFWDEFLAYSQSLTRKEGGNIIQSGAAFGEFKNIDYAKDILSFLILQAGNPIVDSKSAKTVLTESFGASVNPAESALRFFADFSDPSKVSYSWNRSLPSSKNAFIAGILAMYFGYAGEYDNIQEKNPHLNFDISEVPQIREGISKATFGRMQALAVSKSSVNLKKAFGAVFKLIDKKWAGKFAETLYLPPVRRDLLAQNVQDPALAVFYKAAIQSKAWLDPEPQKTYKIFEDAVEAVITGKKKISDAVKDANKKLDDLFLLKR
jgi:ABC-type glycerol-3-phosphate transport system substrate-binding protein